MIEDVEEKVIFLPVLNEHGRSLVESGEWRLGLISKYIPFDSRFILVHQPKKPKQVCRIIDFPLSTQ